MAITTNYYLETHISLYLSQSPTCLFSTKTIKMFSLRINLHVKRYRANYLDLNLLFKTISTAVGSFFF